MSTNLLNRPITTKMFERLSNSKFRVAVCSMQGKRPEMEDKHLIQLGIGKFKNVLLAMVCDGHSGKLLHANYEQKYKGIQTL